MLYRKALKRWFLHPSYELRNYLDSEIKCSEKTLERTKKELVFRFMVEQSEEVLDYNKFLDNPNDYFSPQAEAKHESRSVQEAGGEA
jgi:hypothetical protein